MEGGNWTSLSFAGHGGFINSIAFNYDGSLLGSASDDATARLFAVDTQECVRLVQLSNPGMVFIWRPHDPKEACLWYQFILTFTRSTALEEQGRRRLPCR
jgi:WD40 repeat protein